MRNYKLNIFIPKCAQEIQREKFLGENNVVSLKLLDEIKSVDLSNLVEHRDSIILCDVKPQILKVFEILRLNTAFRIVDTIEEATLKLLTNIA